MYPVSEAYRNAVRARATTTRLSGTIVAVGGYTINFDNTSLSANTFGINSKCVSGSEYELGSVYAAELTMTLKTDIDRYTLYDAVVTPLLEIKLADGSWYQMPLGVYTINEAVRAGRLISIKALDKMAGMSDTSKLVTVNADGSPYDLLKLAANMCDIELAQSEAEIEAMPNGDRMVGFDPNDFTRPTCPRDIVSYVAKWLAGFAIMNRRGELEIRHFATGDPFQLPSDKKTGTSISDFVVHFTAVKCTAGENVYIETLPEEENTGQLLDLGASPFFENGSEDTIREALANILAYVSQTSFVPLETQLSVGGDPSIELGDLIAVEGSSREKGQFFNAYVMSYSWTFRGKHQIKCLGKNPNLTKLGASATEKELQNIANKIAQSEIIYNSYRNTHDIYANPDETWFEIINIAYLAKKTCSGEFKAEILATSKAGEPVLEPIYETQTVFDMVAQSDGSWKKVESEKEVIIGYTHVSTNAIVTFSYFIDDVEVTEIYPKQTLIKGDHIIWLYYPLVDISPSVVHKFKVLMKVSGAGIEIPKFHIIANLIGMGLASTRYEWDGLIEVEEYVPDTISYDIPVSAPITPTSFTVDFSSIVQTDPILPTSFVVIPPLSVPVKGITNELFGTTQFTASAQAGLVIQQQTIDPNALTLNDEVTINNSGNLLLQQFYSYEASELVQTPTGHYISLPIDTVNRSNSILDLTLKVTRSDGEEEAD